ncbi:hypothetical protein RR48_04673 [Papilio machaon]|uniref:Centrosome-associated FAM110 C-terminal domain-containing protein n=1 Tax=Papilio machaon TaxID=76193 RepID=A0A0N0PEC0_PAPMA|nr:hypothetical protein RR48_04673 [Papilio machaon]
MAALSCYQPCRSHLAQPARCLDEDDHNSASLSLRRRQFIERCQESRGGRHRDHIPEVSVKRTRDELTKHAAAAPLTRRLNVDSSWSKVEEVRKKFEGATDTSYSRSFESPPRRRLADSLFASFKLPRKKESMAAPRSLAPQPQQKRKSAVELLAETKAFYVKSETVLDRKQELPLRVSSGLSQAIAAGGCHLVSSGTPNTDACCNPYGTTRSVGGARRAVSAGEGLQNTLRRLLEHSDSRENVYTPGYAISHKIYPDNRRKESYPEREGRSQHTSGTFSGTSSSGTSGSKPHRLEPDRERLSFGDARVFFPESFVIPRQRPSEVIIKNTYSIHSPLNVTKRWFLRSEFPVYNISNSHSQPSMREEESCTNINSHKSLPDLHAQAHTYPEPTTVGGTDTLGRSPRRRRHSAHHRTASCSSKGTRSNHSSMISSCEAFSEHPSPGEENYQSYNSRCGSSFARDSGGSSGHYADTQRSAPPHARAPRADSGSSTQHEHARYRRADGRSASSAPCEGERETRGGVGVGAGAGAGGGAGAGAEEGGDSDSRSEGSARLRHFFERLGLEARQYDALLRGAPPDSPVFFSSASTVDSNQLANAADYTVQGPGVQKQIYRNTEPPSVVERNARIIKWLCQCRKTQMQPPQ